LLLRVTEPLPISVKLDLPKEGLVEARPGEEVQIRGEVVKKEGFKGGVRLTLSNAPEWVSLKSKSFGWRNQGITLVISEEAPPGAFETLVLNGTFSVSKPKDDPTYNPLFKWLNRKTYNFSIGAIPVQIAE